MNLLPVGSHRRLVLGAGSVLGAILGVLYATQDYYPGPYAYVLADAIAASTAIVVLGALTCLLGAYQMSVVVDIWGRFEIRRSAARVVSGLLAPVIAGGVAMTIAVYAVFLQERVFQVSTYIVPITVTIVGLVAWTLIGAALGVTLRPTVAYPISFLAPPFLTAFPISWEPVWLRHLTGAFFDCCTANADLNPRVAAGSLLAMASIALLALGVLVLRLGPIQPRYFTAALIVSAGLGFSVLSVSTVSSLGSSPAVERSAGDAVCADGVCVWPEARSTLGANQRSWTSVRQGWLALGLPIDPSVGIGPVNTENQLGLVVLSQDEETIKDSMVGLLPELLLRCEETELVGQEGEVVAGPVNVAQHELAWLLGQEVGLPESRLNNYKLGFDISPSVDDVQEIWARSRNCAQS